MRGSKAEKSALDARLAELEAELKRVKKNVRLVAKTGRAAPSPVARPKMRRSPAPEPAAPPTPPPEAPAPPPDLFSLAQQRHTPPPAASYGSGRPARMEPAAAPALEDKDKFGRYFTSGSFVASRPMGEERRLFRNKAIFMLVLVVLVAFIFVSLMMWP